MNIFRCCFFVASIFSFMFFYSRPFAFAQEDNVTLYNGKTREEVFEALRIGHDAIMKNISFYPQGTAVSSSLRGLPNDATERPNDATLNPNDANIRPNDATTQPNDATEYPNNALLRPNDATRYPNTTASNP